MSSLVNIINYYGVPASILGLIYYIIKSAKSKSYVSLHGKVVFISGASSGVGEALAHDLYSRGCKVVLAARRESELMRVKKDLLEKQVDSPTFEPLVVYLDLAKFETISEALYKTYQEFGHIDILINNGGISSRGDVVSTDIGVQQQLMNVNHFGPLVLTKGVLPKMIENKSGHILFVSSVQGRVAIPDRSAYAASKHACQAFADTLRAEVHKHDINVSVISPGYIRTALSVNALTGSGSQYGVMDKTTASGYSPEYVAEEIVNMIINKKDELVLCPIPVRVAVLLRCIAPSLYFWIMARRAK